MLPWVTRHILYKKLHINTKKLLSNNTKKLIFYLLPLLQFNGQLYRYNYFLSTDSDFQFEFKIVGEEFNGGINKN